jgi:DNA primase
MGVIDEIKDRADIAEVIGETVRLKKSGKNYSAFCPFHANTRTPAFVVFPDTGTWRCFGACNEGGDVFRFLMKREGWDFSAALHHLAERTGVTLRPRTPEQEAADEAQGELRQLLESAVTFYRNALANTPAVYEYLTGRDLQAGTLEQFGIGYAPDAWDATEKFLADKGYDRQQLMEAGMLVERDDGRTYDRFRNRIMFPIRDIRGRMLGFGARVVDPKDQPKFINSPQTALFDKSNTLYGLDAARRAIRSAEQAIVVEGYLDVIALHQAGYANAVSPMGTALTAKQLRTLKRFSRNIVLALDSDAAGDRATLRGLTVAREALDRDPDPVFDARGLVRHEGRLDAEIRVVALPEGQDPDEVVAEDPDSWSLLIQRAKPVVEYVMDILIRDQDVRDAKVKSQIARQVLPLIEDVGDSVEREAYRQSLARRLQVDERALQGTRGARAVASTAQTGGPTEREATEKFCLGLLLKDPELTYWVDRQLHSLELDGLSSLDFSGTEAQVIFQAVRTSLSQVDEEPSMRWKSLLEGSTLEQAVAYAAQADSIDFDRPKVAEAVSADFLRLRMRRVEGMLQQLSFQQQAVSQAIESADSIRNLAQQAQQLIAQKRRIDVALSSRAGIAGNV